MARDLVKLLLYLEEQEKDVIITDPNPLLVEVREEREPDFCYCCEEEFDDKSPCGCARNECTTCWRKG